jgi:hypothetical protein
MSTTPTTKARRSLSLSQTDIYYLIIIVMLAVTMYFLYSIVQPVKDILISNRELLNTLLLVQNQSYTMQQARAGEHQQMLDIMTTQVNRTLGVLAANPQTTYQQQIGMIQDVKAIMKHLNITSDTDAGASGTGKISSRSGGPVVIKGPPAPATPPPTPPFIREIPKLP